MYSNQQTAIYANRYNIDDSQSDARSIGNNNNSNHNDSNSNDSTRDRSNSFQPFSQYSNSQPITSDAYFNDRSSFEQQPSTKSSYGSSSAINYMPTYSTRYSPITNHVRSGSSDTIGKTNMMSSENPFYDPARSYDHLNSPRKITSITSTPKTGSGINKTLNLSNENPFHAIYGNYRYPSHIDPSKRITNQATTIRSTENKSLNLSDENPFYSNYERYYYPSHANAQKSLTETSKLPAPSAPTKELSNDNPFSNYRPSLIREYSNNGVRSIGSGLNSLSTSIANWTRNNPIPLSYRPIQVQRPPSNFYNQNESSNKKSYIPPVSLPRQRKPSTPPSPLPSPAAPLTRMQSQFTKASLSAPLDKTSLNMSPDNPFADTYGRYYYPSAEEAKIKRRADERSSRFTGQQSNNDNRTKQAKSQMTEYREPEKKDTVSGKGNTKFARFDITF